MEPLALLDHSTELILLEWIAFNIFTPIVLGAMAIALAITYACDAKRQEPPEPRGPAGNIIKGLNWLIFGMAFLSFPFVSLLTWRAMLRIAAGLLITSYLAYKFYDIEYAVKQMATWTSSFLKHGSPTH